MDVRTDVPMDVPTDVPTDVPMDVRMDVRMDVPTDVPMDVRTDVPTDVPMDVPMDVPLDVSLDVPMDRQSRRNAASLPCSQTHALNLEKVPRPDFRGELNSPVVERLNKGLMAMLSPSVYLVSGFSPLVKRLHHCQSIRVPSRLQRGGARRSASGLQMATPIQ
eukprot:186147-Prorocentrum_minimum.AAC.1